METIAQLGREALNGDGVGGLLEAVLQGAADGILVQDVQGRVVYVNEAFTRMAGNQPHAFEALDDSGRPLPQSAHPDRIALEGRRSPTVIARVSSFGGKDERWVQYQATPLFDRLGQVTHTVTIATDVTAAKRAEEGWRFLADATRSLATSLDFGATLERMARLAVPFLADYCLIDLLQEDASVRRQVVAHFDPGESRRVAKLRHYHSSLQQPHRVLEAIRTGEPQLHTAVSPSVVEEYSYTQEDLLVLRELGFASAMVVPLSGRRNLLGGGWSGAGGAVVFVSASRSRRYGASDLSLARELVRGCSLAVENAQLYAEARQQRQALQTLLDSIMDGVLSLDAELFVRQANAGATRLLGLAPDRLEGKHLEDIFKLFGEGEKRPTPLHDLVAQAIAGEPVALEDLSLAVDGGTRMPVSVTIAARPADGSIAKGAVVLFRDVTKRKEVDELRELVISLVSHELKTPLAHIKGFASSLLQTDVEWDEDTRRDFLQTIDREADRLARTVSDILEISRVQGRPLTSREAVSVTNLIGGALDQARIFLSKHHMVVDVAQELPRIAVDIPHIERVLVNLLENAAKYSPAGTSILVSARRAPHGIVVSIADEGPGIPEAHQERIFEKFFRFRHDRMPQPPGTGLGLSLCKTVVEAHGGTIWVKNRPDGGSVFSFTLPALATAEATALAERPKEPATGGHKLWGGP